MIVKTLKNMRNAIPCVVTAVIAALGCADTPLAQAATFVITGVDSANSITLCGPSAVQQFTFATSSGTASPYTITVQSQNNYLQISTPVSGTLNTTAETRFLSSNSSVTSGLAAGTYTGTVTISAPNFTSAMFNTNLIIGQSSCSSGGGTGGNLLSANLASPIVFSGAGTRSDLVVSNTSGQNGVTIFGSASSNNNFL